MLALVLKIAPSKDEGAYNMDAQQPNSCRALPQLKSR